MYLPSHEKSFKDVLERIHSTDQIYRVTEQVMTKSCGSPSKGATSSFQQKISGFAFSEPFAQVVDGMFFSSRSVMLP